MISPFTIDIPDERLATIKAKVVAYDWSQLPEAGRQASGFMISSGSLHIGRTATTGVRSNGALTRCQTLRPTWKASTSTSFM